MKSKKKVLGLVICAVLLVVGSVMGTMAYLTKNSEVATNTFTVGNVTIKLDEAKVTEYGVKDGDARVLENTYKLIPGHTYVKDPTVYVDGNSEDAWLFVKVVDGIKDIEAATTIHDQMTARGWSAVEGEAGVYAYHAIVSAGDKIVVFENFTVKDDANVAAYNGKTIKVEAYAVQADGFTTSADAWEDAKAAWKI